MSQASDPALLSITAARRELAARRISAVELTQAVLDRVDRLGERLGAYLYVDADAALIEAHEADRRADGGPLLGVPMCIKDMIDVAGAPTTAGASGWRRDPDTDATAVARLRAAGAVVIGKGHTNEFAYGIDGQNPHWGDCVNPYDTGRICGGSSSGPAVATAAGLALAGLGTDTSGSIRVPASLCGLVGIRPTPGRVPLDGVIPLAWSYDTVGPLARSVADAALLLEVLTGERVELTEEPAGLRVGVLEQLLQAAEPDIATAVSDAAGHLESLGAQIVPMQSTLLEHAPAIHLIVQHVEAAQAHAAWFDGQRERYSDAVRLRLEAGRLLPASAYLTAQQARRLLIEDVARAMEGVDAVLAPVTPTVAPPLGATEVEIRGVPVELRTALLSCAVGPSELACPVVSLPVGSHDGLPFGMQIIGAPDTESRLLSIAAACEERWPWEERRPAI